jgi:cobalt-zinc-cadmium efflux system outer membrane protein
VKSLLFSLVVAVFIGAKLHAQNTGEPMPPAEVRLLPSIDAPQLAQPESPEPLPLGDTLPKAPAALGLAELENIALANNPSLRELGGRVNALRGEWVQVGLPPNPTAGYLASEIGDSGTAGQQGAFVGQEFVTGGKLRLSRAVASQDIQAAEQQLAAQRFRVLTDVRIRFYEVLIAQRRAELSSQLLDVATRAVKTADTFFQRQEGNKVDLLQSRIEAGTARMQLKNAENDQLAAWRRLAIVAGSPDMPPARLSGDIEASVAELTFDDATQKLTTASPEIALAQARLERARFALRRACAQRVPNVDVQASVQHDNSTQDEIAGVQVGLPVPIWNRNQGGIQRAQGELLAAQSGIERVEFDLYQRLASSYQRYANARQQVEIYRKDILPDANSSLDLVTQGYQQGEFGYLALLTAQRTYFQTNLAYLESLRELQQASALIDGMLLSESLSLGDTGQMP